MEQMISPQDSSQVSSPIEDNTQNGMEPNPAPLTFSTIAVSKEAASDLQYTTTTHKN